MAVATRPFDTAEYLEGAADQADLLNDAVDSGDACYIAYALGAVARGGIGNLEREADMNCQTLHKALSEDDNPPLGTVLKALGLHCGSRRRGRHKPD